MSVPAFEKQPQLSFSSDLECLQTSEYARPIIFQKKKSLIDKGFSRTFSFLQEQKWVKLA